ncbi:MAG: site-specific integrase [Gracilibacteraceae bacterium]|jgi:integrase|nr:site-specific integrase [Gracilibacteraceae bacterium]
MASIRKRGETYHIAVSLGVDENFKQVRKYTTFDPPHGMTVKQAKKAADEYAREFELKCKGLTAYDENMTLTELCAWYYENIAPNRIRERTQENSRYRLDLWVLPKLGKKKLRDLKPAVLAAHFAEMLKSGGARTRYRTRSDFDLKAAITAKGLSYRELERQGVCSRVTRIAGGGATQETCQRICDYLDIPLSTAFEERTEHRPLSANTVKCTQTSLSAVFSAAVKAEIITQNPLANVDPPTVGEIDQPVLTPDQARLVRSRLEAVEHISVGALLITALYTGARTGELRALKWSDVNLDAGFIDICKSVDHKGRVTQPKTRSSKRVRPIDQAYHVKFLRQYRARQAAQILAAGSRWTDNKLVFPNLTGGYLSATLANKILKSVIQDMDIPQTLHAHSLRHSFASIAIDSGANVKTVQDALGHSSSSITLDIYAHSFAAAQARATEAVSLAITGGVTAL